jgi:oligoendopeptidase F
MTKYNRQRMVGCVCSDKELQGYRADKNKGKPLKRTVKSHYYGPTFYNYPYTFGLLFGLGIYALYREDADAFRARYDDFLSRTGMADARTLGEMFGMDVTQEAFWTASLDIIREQIEEFERLVTTS